MTRRYQPALPYVQRNGRQHYFRHGNSPPVRLPGEPLSPEYIAAYNAAYVQVFNRPAPLPLLLPSLPAQRAPRARSYVYIIGDLHDGRDLDDPLDAAVQGGAAVTGTAASLAAANRDPDAPGVAS
jgi:hypothetical protein